MRLRGVVSLVLALSMILALSGCHISIAPPVGENPIDNPGPGTEPSYGYKVISEIGSLQLVFQTEKDSYSVGELIPLKLEVINTGSAPIKLIFPTSRTFDLIVKRDGAQVWQLSFGRHYLQVLTELTVKPSEPLIFMAGWAQVDNAGHQVPEGIYEIIALLPTSLAGEPLTSAPLLIQIQG